jgi:hypothetical protein
VAEVLHRCVPRCRDRCQESANSLLLLLLHRWPREFDGHKFGNYIQWLKSCSLLSALDLPAVSVPCGLTASGKGQGRGREGGGQVWVGEGGGAMGVDEGGGAAGSVRGAGVIESACSKCAWLCVSRSVTGSRGGGQLYMLWAGRV